MHFGEFEKIFKTLTKDGVAGGNSEATSATSSSWPVKNAEGTGMGSVASDDKVGE